ncbi:hypothetical protein [Streptomyces caatingaensis]|nr:hypothetical protein [Streptomyces caatingaensis]
MRLPPALLALASALALTLSSAAAAHAQDELGLNYKYFDPKTETAVGTSLAEQPPLNECILIQDVEQLSPDQPNSSAFGPQNISTRANAQLFASDDCTGTPKAVLKPGSDQQPDSLTFRSVKFVLP